MSARMVMPYFSVLSVLRKYLLADVPYALHQLSLAVVDTPRVKFIVGTTIALNFRPAAKTFTLYLLHIVFL